MLQPLFGNHAFLLREQDELLHCCRITNRHDKPSAIGELVLKGLGYMIRCCSNDYYIKRTMFRPALISVAVFCQRYSDIRVSSVLRLLL